MGKLNRFMDYNEDYDEDDELNYNQKRHHRSMKLENDFILSKESRKNKKQRIKNNRKNKFKEY